MNDNFRKNERMEGRTLTIDGAEFADTREELETDAGELVADYAATGSVCDALYRGILELLDRQAAITEANCRMEYEDMRDYLQARVDSLEDKRDCGTAEAEPSQVQELDSREKLEADVRSHFWHNDWCRTEMVIGWLDRQAAITARECAECAEGFGRELDARCDPLKERIADLQSQLEEVTRAYKERGRIIAELREQLRNDGEPFCETVKRWLTDDAPEECIECEYGCWRRMHELMAEECDSCEPMHSAEREIEELKAFCKRVEEAVGNGEELTLSGVDYVPAKWLDSLPKTADECEACQDAHDRLMYTSGERIKELEAERDHMQRVIQAQAESFRKLEAASAMPADCTECQHLDELRALRRRIRKLARFAGLLD